MDRGKRQRIFGRGVGPRTGSRHREVPCGLYDDEDYDAYLEHLMSSDRARAFERHLARCPSCSEGLKAAMDLDRRVETMTSEGELASYRGRILDGIGEEAESRPAALLAASSEDEPLGEPDHLGIAHGLAVDPEGEKGFLVECTATLSPGEAERGGLTFNADQMTGFIRQWDRFYETSPPFQFVQNKLRELFTGNGALLPFSLGRRDIHVEIEHRAEGACFKDAKSLTLAILMGILCGRTGRALPPSVAFAARVRQDGALHPGVSDLSLKLMAAKREGLREVVLSRLNQGDCPTEFLEDPDLRLRFFTHIGEVFAHYGFLPPEETRPAIRGEAARERHEAPRTAAFRSPLRSEGWRSLVARAEEKGLRGEIAAGLLSTLEDLCQTRSETRPISMTVLVGDPAQIASALQASPLRFAPAAPGRPPKEFLEVFAPLSEGEMTGVGLDLEGRVLGLYRLNKPLQAPCRQQGLLYKPVHRFAALSSLTGGLVFFLDPCGNRIFAFSDGGQVCRYANGVWQACDVRALGDCLVAAAREKGYARKPLLKVGRAALRMSYLHLGALFVMHPTGVSLEEKTEDCLRNRGMEMTPLPLDRLSEEELVAYAREDGAVLVDGEGTLRNFMVYLKPTITERLDYEPGVGARHISARRFSAEIRCLTLVVSEDGGITVYVDGKKRCKL